MMEPLTTKRLILRNYIREDIDDFYEYISDEETVRYEPYRITELLESYCELLRRLKTDEFIAVELVETHKMIGNLYLAKREQGSYELGFVFNRNYWRCGYALESCQCLVTECFKQGAHRIYAECDPRNENSWRLLEALGFHREAHLRQNVYFWTDEQGTPIYKDTYIYAALASEWQ